MSEHNLPLTFMGFPIHFTNDLKLPSHSLVFGTLDDYWARWKIPCADGGFGHDCNVSPHAFFTENDLVVSCTKCNLLIVLRDGEARFAERDANGWVINPFGVHPKNILAGDLLDRMVAERVMKWDVNFVDKGFREGRVQWRDPWNNCIYSPDQFCPSGNIADAWQVVEKLLENGWELTRIEKSAVVENGRWLVQFYKNSAHPGTTGPRALADTVTLAICRAALMAADLEDKANVNRNHPDQRDSPQGGLRTTRAGQQGI